MSNPNVNDFNPGGIVDRVDNRDFMYDEVGGVPMNQFDWQAGFDVEVELGRKLVVKDQASSFSCGGQAWSYYAETLEALSTKTYEPRSAKFLYSQTCVPGGGSRGRDNADIFVNQGVCKESVLSSYDNGQPPSEAFMQRSVDITTAARMDAKLSRASAYAQTGSDIDSVATAIQQNHGVILGIDGQNNGTWSSEFPKPPTVTAWRHWVFACGAKLIDGVKYIKIINSWGTDVGDKGVQWLGADYFTSHIFSGWTHVFAPLNPPFLTHEFKVIMNFGDNNTEVSALQSALRLDGEFPISVASTGVYGDITRAAVLAFQLKNGIVSLPAESNNGKIVGPKTLARLNLEFNS